MHDNPVQEARRYINQARETLSKFAKKEDGLYSVKKYVKIAGHQAYKGVLIALDAVTPKTNTEKDVDFYKKELAKLDKEIVGTYTVAYENLHMFMGYDGAISVAIAESGLYEAETIIDWVEARLI
ncbi:hypothetical protein GCM10028807_38010 [Spirosoma daeguense]